ncbi:hypothetical protein [Propionivibrio dicarboxylicus]|uniref:Uncharacterized protein n=1 Tax=Propionivibrio dicarboxylicus TaxID=83767 RepID=A0A1G8N4Y1_9RHOO|nr:hypothetical protein [Propionivibrio dicarboxylicus]SDI75117.1 hypothetical protein SAMN05660652_03978 [Propionivibrio dicarboxylicus]
MNICIRTFYAVLCLCMLMLVSSSHATPARQAKAPPANFVFAGQELGVSTYAQGKKSLAARGKPKDAGTDSESGAKLLGVEELRIEKSTASAVFGYGADERLVLIAVRGPSAPVRKVFDAAIRGIDPKSVSNSVYYKGNGQLSIIGGADKDATLTLHYITKELANAIALARKQRAEKEAAERSRSQLIGTAAAIICVLVMLALLAIFFGKNEESDNVTTRDDNDTNRPPLKRPIASAPSYGAATAALAVTGTAVASHAYSASQDDDDTSFQYSAPLPQINPANGYPMIADTNIDVGGNAYGTSQSYDSDDFDTHPSVNPANGYPMIDNSCFDVAGNTFGTSDY